MTQQAVNENRVKIFVVKKRDVMSMLFTRQDPDCIVLNSYTEDIPKDCNPIAVYELPGWMAFGILVAHPSFPVVKDGYKIPIVDTPVTITRKFAIRQPDGTYKKEED
jgi:hypothetical protein